MSVIVVDASVVVKWFLPEDHADEARALLTGRRRLLAPDLIWPEIGNTLWKKQQRAELTLEEARAILRDVCRFPLETHPTGVLLHSAWELAGRFKITVYDSMYLALAVANKCRLVTADRRLIEALKGESLAASVLWIGRGRIK